MDIYLPIADLPISIFVLLALGLAVGFVSGMFGVGGGFLMTPLLIFLGVAPGVAVATVATHITASSFSGTLSYWRRRAVDIQMAMALLAGGMLGTSSGIWLFATLRSLGQLDLMISFSYLMLLTAVGGLMVMESVRSIVRQRQARTLGFTAYRSNFDSGGRKFLSRLFRSLASATSSPLSALSWVSAGGFC